MKPSLQLLLAVVGSLLRLSFPEDIVYDQLKRAQASINANTSAFCYHNGHSQTRASYLGRKFDSFLKPQHAIVYPFCLTTHELGNRLGNYFQEVACAEASGLHFIAVHSQWESLNAINGNLTHLADQAKARKAAEAFFRGFPDVIVHPHPADSMHTQSRIQHECKCTRYCWGNKDATWVNRTANIRTYVQKAVQSYMQSIDFNARTTIDPAVDLSNAKDSDPLPLIPEVAIQYRCGDNIAFSYHYGILPFTFFDGKIPNGTKTIYVLSDHPSRAMHSPYTNRCKIILEKLFEYLTVKYPSSTIVVKRGGDLFLDFSRFALAKITICSASTFCFWSGLSSNGETYFPITPLIANADNMQLAPYFHAHFHWIEKPEIISSFKPFRPWTAVLDVLTGKVPPPK